MLWEIQLHSGYSALAGRISLTHIIDSSYTFLGGKSPSSRVFCYSMQQQENFVSIGTHFHVHERNVFV